MRNALLFIFLIFLLRPEVYAQTKVIDTVRIKNYLEYLASDELSGRYPGSDGARQAEAFIAGHFRKCGYMPLGNDGVQPFDLTVKDEKNGTKTVIKTSNVVFYKKGTLAPDEYIVLGAHYDHLGMGGYGSGSRKPDTVAVHNGADDNASGVSVMMACAEALASVRTDRSIIFIAFSAEEEGLVGSKYFVEHPLVPLTGIKAMLNLDMVGRLDSVLTISGTKTAAQFDSLISLVYQKYKTKPFQLKQDASGFGPSDQTSFCVANIPVLFFHTSIHEQYHTPEDDSHLINVKGCGLVGDFVMQILKPLTSKGQLLTYQMVGNPSSSRGSVKVSLGIMPDHTSDGGLKVDGVKAGSVAEKSGIRKGDIIIKIGEAKIQDIESYMNALNKLEKGQTFDVVILRGGVEQVLQVHLP